jgi:hypothetical protein
LGSGCGDDGTGVEDQTGATLQGQIVVMGVEAGAELGLQDASALGSILTIAAPTSDVSVTIGGKSTRTDASGSFVLNNIPLGNQTVVFSGSGITGSYSLDDVVENEVYALNGVRVAGGLVKTSHTGTWLGTAGSTQAGSHGQIAFTLTIAANGNALSGSGSIEVEDTTYWSMSGTETGRKVDGTMTLLSTNSACATGGTFIGTFSADTLSGTFVEVNPPAGCGTPESGTFRVVKQ